MPLTNTRTYSEVHGKKREPVQVKPNLVYEASMEFVTDKKAELLFVQHKFMREFLSKKGLIEEFNQFQKKKQSRSTGDYAEWFKRWN